MEEERSNIGSLASKEIQGPETKTFNPEELLFRPIVYMKGRHGSPEFSIYVPFLIKNGNMFLLDFIDGCGGQSLYVEMWKADAEQFDGYEDAIPYLKDCLEVQKQTGVQYYFGHADKAVRNWLYTLQLFMDKGIIDVGKALELAGELGIEKENMQTAAAETAAEVAKSDARMARMRGEQKTAADAMMEFVSLMNDAVNEAIQESESRLDD